MIDANDPVAMPTIDKYGSDSDTSFYIFLTPLLWAKKTLYVENAGAAVDIIVKVRATCQDTVECYGSLTSKISLP